ncbi:hypothetical protein [Prosthecobacter sp.]|uniref:hypothetical protein n=1 Tax=Prosthecobacter sp. TaxID=1965333 RepID=UPI001D91C41B|nr:hypothetical protein [Prosthecobacter sp.]MCB1277856.1 hypothetical protein [Prosthecobacter sp.]
MALFATSLELLQRRRLALSVTLGVLVGLAMFALGEQPAADDSGMGAFLKMVPPGAVNKGAVIPSFDASGRRTSLITADVVRRVDDERLYAEKLVVQMFNADPGKDLRIDLKTAFYQMAASGGVLRSTERSRVSRPDFEIEGDGLIFDTAKNQGRMTGNIRMVIFDSGSLSGEGTSPSKPRPTK